MSGSELRIHPLLRLEHFECSNAGCENSRLSVFCQFQCLFWSLETKFRNGEAKGLIRFLKDLFRYAEMVVEFLAHSDILGALTREDKGYLFHGYFFPAYSLLNSNPMTFRWI